MGGGESQETLQGLYFISTSLKPLGKSLIKFPRGLDNFWLIARLVVLLTSSQELAGPVRERKKTSLKEIALEPLETVWQEMPCPTLALRESLARSLKTMPTLWEPSGLRRSLKSLHVEEGRRTLLLFLFQISRVPLKQWADLSESR